MDKKLKKVIEERNAKLAEMNGIADAAAGEVRALTDEEDERFSELEAEVRGLDDLVAKIEGARKPLEGPAEGGEGETQEDAEVRAFAAYVRGEVRADANLTAGENGAVVPKTIADRIIKKVVERSPVVERAQRFTVKGALDLPYYDEETSAVTVAYADEFTDAESTTGKFAKISLTGHLARALTKVSRSLMNSADVDVVNFVVEDMAEKIALWLEKEILLGTTNKITGLTTVANVVTAAATTAVTADELIDVQDAVIDAYQKDAIWIMNRATRTAIRKLKDGNDRYLLQDDVTAPFGKVLLGKPVYTSDNMPGMAAGKTAIYYGDMKGLAIKFSEDPNVQILQELLRRAARRGRGRLRRGRLQGADRAGALRAQDEGVMMILKAEKSFSGAHGSAGKGTTFEVDEKTGAAMLSDGYPVKEVRPDGGARRKPAKPKRDADTA